jgi:hypothetical protein
MAMPHFDKFVWTKGEECYSMTAEEVGDQKPPPPTAGLQKREIEAIVAYLKAKVVGKGPPTVADCEEYFGQGSGCCREMAAGRNRQKRVAHRFGGKEGQCPDFSTV